MNERVERKAGFKRKWFCDCRYGKHPSLFGAENQGQIPPDGVFFPKKPRSHGVAEDDVFVPDRSTLVAQSHFEGEHIQKARIHEPDSLPEGVVVGLNGWRAKTYSFCSQNLGKILHHGRTERRGTVPSELKIIAACNHGLNQKDVFPVLVESIPRIVPFHKDERRNHHPDCHRKTNDVNQ